MEKLIIGGGCFWGMEELFRKLPGVINTRVGYAGGENDDPTYENHPGHAEVLEVAFDTTKITRAELLDYFFRIHDPTTLNQQGNDIGTSYRSVIFVSSDEERGVAREAIERNQKNWSEPIVTAIEPFSQFWLAEGYHQDYLQKNPHGYTCHFEREF